MFTTRNVVVSVIATFILCMLWSIWSLMGPPDSGGLGGDSYGTRRHGLRALFEILAELHVPVERGLSPPTFYLDRPATLVFWKPDTTLVTREPTYLHAVGDWIHQGGRVVLAPDRHLEDEGAPENVFTKDKSTLPPESVFQALQGPDIDVQLMDLVAGPTKAADDQDESVPETRRRQRNARKYRPADWNDDIQRMRGLMSGEKNLQPTQKVAVRASGSLAPLGAKVKSLELPIESLQVLDLKKSQPTGRIEFTDLEGQTQTLVAAYRVGQGELIVVGSAMLAENRLIARDDNSVLAAELLAASGRTVIMDEFYHGLTVRGNPMWLFTRPGYGVVVLAFLAVAGLWIWREAVFLGPPLAESIPSRRSIGEYIVAMAMFLNRGQATRPFVLREVRSGVLHSVRRELGLPPGREDVEELAAVLLRRDPQRAMKLIDAVRQIDQALSQNIIVRESDAIRLLQGISSCL